MKPFVKRNLLSIILAGVIILMIPAVIILPKKLNTDYELAGTYNRNGQMHNTYVDYSAVIEKISGGGYQVTYTEKSNVDVYARCSCEFIIPEDYKYGTEISTNDKDSIIEFVVVDMYPGHIYMEGYSDSSDIYMEQIMRKEDYSEYNPVVETILISLLTLVSVAFVISIIWKLRAYVGVGITVVATFLAVIAGVKSAEIVDYEGYYTIKEFPDVKIEFFSYNDIYLKKTGQNTYKMLTNIVGQSMLSSTFFSNLLCVADEAEVEYEDGQIIIDTKDVGNVGLSLRKDVYFEKQGDSYALYANKDKILCEYTQDIGKITHDVAHYIVRGIGVLMLLAVTVSMFIRDSHREKPDVFEPYYGVYSIGELICAGDGYSDYASHAVKGIAGTLMVVEKESFVINDNCYDNVTYEFDKSMELPEDMSSAFKRAKVINVGVENNRYYLLHTRKHKAVITTLGDKILMACKAYRHKEGEMEDGSR